MLLLGVDGDDALDHAREDGAELLAVLVDLGELGREPLAHVVERARSVPTSLPPPAKTRWP